MISQRSINAFRFVWGQVGDNVSGFLHICEWKTNSKHKFIIPYIINRNEQINWNTIELQKDVAQSRGWHSPFFPLEKNFRILSNGVGVLISSFSFFCILSYSSLIAVSCRCLSLKLCCTSFRFCQFSTSLSTSDIVKTLFLKSFMISRSSSCGPDGSLDLVLLLDNVLP